MKVQDRVRDKFKPKTGDECVTGTIVRMDGSTMSASLEMDDGTKRTISLMGLEASFEVIDEDDYIGLHS